MPARNRAPCQSYIVPMKTQPPIIVPAATVRNPFALHAKQRRAAKFKDRREGRGGARNKQREYRDEE